nr:hypothetical protein [Trebonia kvetii]
MRAHQLFRAYPVSFAQRRDDVLVFPGGVLDALGRALAELGAHPQRAPERVGRVDHVDQARIARGRDDELVKLMPQARPCLSGPRVDRAGPHHTARTGQRGTVYARDLVEFFLAGVLRGQPGGDAGKRRVDE